MWIEREIQQELVGAARDFPVVAVDGPCGTCESRYPRVETRWKPVVPLAEIPQTLSFGLGGKTAILGQTREPMLEQQLYEDSTRKAGAT